MDESARRDPRAVVDGQEVVADGATILEAAADLGIGIPTLCHDPRVAPAGACRLCLVEVEGASQLRPACATPLEPGMVVRTDTGSVERNRRFILSLHLADTVADRETAEDNNPSRLHELAQIYGTAGAWAPVVSPRQSRPDDANPFIEFRGDRCIACSLCTRYCEEVEAVSAISLSFRGAETTISTAAGRGLTETTCELCGGCVDVCPTGAMTEKPALLWGRPERELDKVRTTCNFCGVGCQLDLNVDREADRVVKVTSPPPGTTLNDGNLCVKGRFANDFIHHEDRLRTPLARDGSGALVPVSWDEALDRAAAGLRGVADRHGADAMAFVSSSRCTGEENYLMQKLARVGFKTHNVHQCAAT